jgi:hypothetical protein
MLFRVISIIKEQILRSSIEYLPPPKLWQARGEGRSTISYAVKSISKKQTMHLYVPKANLERGLRDDLWIGLVLFVDGQKPTKYLFPSTVWQVPNQLFTDSAIKNQEYGISLNQHTIKMLVEKYAFENTIQEI